ncbi:RNA polymerase sigma factor [Nonomuraea ferruginea]|uniref:RNA polymerase sigma factor n=1 Tax=Nonomuraea ferruginea TaxID=46174 RepID=UPI0036095832
MPTPSPISPTSWSVSSPTRSGWPRCARRSAECASTSRTCCCCAWAGLDYAEAAEALGIPIGTVRSRLSRARKKLELALSRRQMNGDRGTAVRPVKESTR